MSFAELSLSKPIHDALSIYSFTQMTPVQSATIPLLNAHKDVIVEAVTGSGKTLAFLIPIMEILLRRIHQDHQGWKKHEIGALVISPTRELARQIFDVCTTFVECVNRFYSTQPEYHLSHSLFIGGSSVEEDMNSFKEKGGTILVGTPGRLQDLFLRHSSLFKPKSLEVLILDEADKLLDMGFFHSLNAIIQILPKQRRTGLFSATMTEGLNELVRVGLRNPVKVVVKLSSPERKLSWLLHLLTFEQNTKSIIYFSTCAVVDYYFRIFSQISEFESVKFFSLHGKMDPKRREAVYEKYTHFQGSCALLCTDIAARGLDIPDIHLVIQYDPPQDVKSFAHRCGRTARMGKSGKAIVLLDPKEDTYIEFLNIRKVPVMPLDIPEPSSDLLLDQLVKLNQSDRDLYEKSIKAFVSWVRSYNEHEANYIFNLKNINLGLVAKAFGLFRMPKMPELKTLQIQFDQVQVNVNEIPYKDPSREKQRQKNLTSAVPNKIGYLKKKKVESWSNQKEAKEKRLIRKMKKEKRQVAISKAKQDGTFIPKTKKSIDEEDWLEMQQEARKIKKQKKSGQADSSDDLSS